VVIIGGLRDLLLVKIVEPILVVAWKINVTELKKCIKDKTISYLTIFHINMLKTNNSSRVGQNQTL
jgi:hypothetical protein